MGLYRYQPSLTIFKRSTDWYSGSLSISKTGGNPFQRNRFNKESPVLVNFRWTIIMIGFPDKVGALAPRQFSQIVYPIGHSQR
jgi:hypothetical protein